MCHVKIPFKTVEVPAQCAKTLQRGSDYFFLCVQDLEKHHTFGTPPSKKNRKCPYKKER